MTELVSSLNNLLRIFGGRTTVLRCIDMLSTEDRGTALRYLLDGGTTAYPEPLSEGTGLPQKLRGAVHELTRKYQANLVVDAAMLEMPEEHREAIARCFLPKEAKKAAAVRSELVERATGKVLHAEDGMHYGPPVLLVTEDGEDVVYVADRAHHLGSVETRILPDGSKVIRNYFVKDAEQ